MRRRYEPRARRSRRPVVIQVDTPPPIVTVEPPVVYVEPTPVVVRDSDDFFFSKLVPLAVLVASALAAYFAWHTDRQDTAERARRPILMLSFANGESTITLPGHYFNRLTTMEVYGDLIIRDSGTKAATNVVVNVYAPRDLQTPTPTMPGVGGIAGQLRFLPYDGPPTSEQNLQGVTRAIAFPAAVVNLETQYNVGTFAFAASSGTYQLLYTITCTECEGITRGPLTLTVVEPPPSPPPAK